LPAADSRTTLGTLNAITSDRINVWRSVVSIAAQRPLTGTGPAAFELGWYPNAFGYSSDAGAGAIADDPHSFVAYILATTGIPGLLAYLIGVAAALVIGARNAVALARRPDRTGKGSLDVAWVGGVGLLVAAVTTPIVMLAFLSYAVLLRPAARVASGGSPWKTRAGAIAGTTLAIALVIAIYPQASAEFSMARAAGGGSLDEARAAARLVPWNLDIQKGYYHLRTGQTNALLAAGSAQARDSVDALVGDLAGAGATHPRELYYPSVRAQILAEASNRLGDLSYAQAALVAADEALAIMPTHLPTLVNKALALNDLERYAEMAATLRDYWRNELSSPYPGLLYAQALAFSDRPADAAAVFAELETRFPGDASIAESRLRIEESLRGR
jgi:hypothetical protein